MKQTLLTLLGVFFFFSSTLAQKTHFDNKPYVEGEFLVQITAEGSIRELISRAPADYSVNVIEESSRPMRIWLLEFNDDVISHEQFQYWLYSQPEVSVADYNYYIQMRATVPNDASFTQQWHHKNTGQTGGTNDADIDSDLAWDITTGGTTANGHDIVVCMVESSGGNLDHQDLSPNRWTNAGEAPPLDNNGVDDDGNGYIDDYWGWNTGSNNDNTGTGAHGTNCLGMIGAKGNNATNVVGANWDVKLMVLNMGGGLTQSNVINAYTYPLVQRQIWNNTGGTQGAFVVATSSSWGIDGANPASYPLWCQFYDTLGYYGVLNVGATTNSNLDVDVAGDMPTACASDYMIGVGRTDHNDGTAGGYGDMTIELGAPGINVVTTAGSTGITTTTGTSFSCPLTAGVIGLAYSIPCTDFMTYVMSDPQGGADMVLAALLSGTDPKPALATKFVTGGRLNAKNTLDDLIAVGCSGAPCIAPSSSTVGPGTTDADITYTPSASATSTNLYWRPVGSPTWTAVTGAVSPVMLTGLTACTDYEYYLESICGVDTSPPSSTQTFTTIGCGNCVDLSYCNSQATDAVDEWIDAITIGTYTNTSGNDNGYGDYTTSSSIALTEGQTYSVTIVPAWGGTQYDEYTRIWVDLNQDGTFAASEMMYDQGAATQTNATGTLNIPAGTTVGNTRMRVQMAYLGTGQSTLPDVCDVFQWGEVEDYCVDIAAGSTSIQEMIDSYVSVYPNPGKDLVNFEIKTSEVTAIEIVDVVGKVVYRTAVKGQTTQIDVSKYTNGTYFYRLSDTTGNALKVDKLMIAK